MTWRGAAENERPGTRARSVLKPGRPALRFPIPRGSDSLCIFTSQQREIPHKNDQAMGDRILRIPGSELSIVIRKAEVEWSSLRIGKDFEIGVAHGELSEAQN